MKKVKKRKIKKSVKVVFFIIFILIFVLVFLPKKNSTVEKVKKHEKVEAIDIKESNVKKMSLIAVGDVLIHESVYKDALDDNGTYNFSKMFDLVSPIIKKYDLKFCNQESTIGGNILGISGYPLCNSPDEIGDELVSMGFNLISLANNHALDKGVDAVLYSNSYWKEKDVITAGAYSTKEERDKVNIYDKNGIKYAFFAYTTLSNNKVPNDYIINMYSDERVKEDIEKVKGSVDVIIVSMHWGEEFSNVLNKSQKEIAKYLSDLGVNIIIGSHPHVVQPIEYIGDTLVIYSLGNFISNQLSLNLNSGIGLMVGMDIKIEDNKVIIDNLYKELILQYAENSTNFKVIPFSKLNDEYLENYKSIEDEYMKIVTGDLNG